MFIITSLALLINAVSSSQTYRQDAGAAKTIGAYDYGYWSNEIYCDPGLFVGGLSLFFDDQGGDDEGALAIQLWCFKPVIDWSNYDREWLVTNNNNDALVDGTRYYGLWDTVFCSGENAINALRPIDGYSSSYGMINMRALCTNNQEITPHTGLWDTYYPTTSWYTEGDRVECDDGEAICGYAQQIDEVGTSDDSGLNQVKFYCCPLPKDSVLTGCEVKKYDPDDEQNFLSQLTVRGDYYESISYINSNPRDSETVLWSTQNCVTETSTFRHLSGEEMAFGVEINFKIETGFNIGIASVGTTLERGFSFNSKYYEEYESIKTESKETCTTKPPEEYECPARTTCERKYLVLIPSTNTFPMTLTAECDNGISRENVTIQGEFKTSGAVKIEIYDSSTPLDCTFYTNDYYDRFNGKLPFCDTCSPNADETHQCDICRDYMVLLDGQCITDQICVSECGGEVKGDTADGISSVTPFSGAYCFIIDQNKYDSDQCQDILSN